MKTPSHPVSFQTSNLPLLVLLACLMLLAVACGGPADRSASSPAQAESDADAAEREDAVEYEPAYPEDVSADGLSESDTAQQHGHSHDEGEPMHDDSMHDDHDGEHPHGDEGDHPHGDDDDSSH